MLTGVTLDVSAIDGRMVKGPFWIEIRGAAIQKGTRYRLEGYESGEFAGSPSWLGGQRVFGFSSFFVVTKVIEPVVTKVIEPSPQR
jgi:hypothetical protein